MKVIMKYLNVNHPTPPSIIRKKIIISPIAKDKYTTKFKEFIKSSFACNKKPFNFQKLKGIFSGRSSIAENITPNNLTSRIKYNAHLQDELGRLRDTLNNLFTRLEVQINQISQFTDNASHQLMTPLTALKTELKYILKRERKPEEYKNTLNMLNVQTDKLISIIKSLLVIAKYSGNTESHKSVFKLSQVINDQIKPSF